MKKNKLNTLLIALSAILLLLIIGGCEKKEIKIGGETDNLVSKFVYDGMSSLYLWNNELIGKAPSENDTNPEKYFYSLLNKTDTEHGWSWITNDAEGLKAEFAGEPKAFGYTLSFMRNKDDIYALVKYVYENTPAQEAGMNRLDFIGKVNGRKITADAEGYISSADVEALYGNNSVKLTIYKLTEEGFDEDREITITPRIVQTNPVLYSDIYKEGNKKIGYLVYNSFISNFNDKLFDVFKEFKREKVDELILDLRYNHGGEVSAAQFLASMIAPEEEVKKKPVFTKLSYNKEIGSNIYKLGETDKNQTNPIEANLNLNKVYIIATNDSYSASELTTFCLREFMNVVHIGNKTGGKYTASITVHPFNEELGYPLYPSEFFPRTSLAEAAKERLANWAMQPIVAKYTNNKGDDFIATDGLLPDVELKEGFGYIDLWTQFGDIKDVLLGQALYEITQNSNYKPIKPKSTRGSDMAADKIKVKSINKADEIRRNSVILDSF